MAATMKPSGYQEKYSTHQDEIMKNQSLILFLALTGITYSQSASAYLDPGAGSLMIQMFIAGVMGALFTIKLYWFQLRAYIDRLLGREIESSLDTPDDALPDARRSNARTRASTSSM